MNLFELVNLGISPRSERVPEWTLGCFRRRSISFYTGETDERTRVIWLQSHGLTVDFRLQPDRPLRLEGASPDQLLALAAVESGLAHSRWDGRAMHWEEWVSFQTHAKWPEPGELRRVGDALIEFAPSGAYVEDWRLEPSAPGALIGLCLVEERDLETQRILHRGGGLVVCGDHAALIRGRPNPPTWQGRVSDHLRANSDDPAALSAVFSFDGVYAQKDRAGGYVVRAATNPSDWIGR